MPLFYDHIYISLLVRFMNTTDIWVKLALVAMSDNVDSIEFQTNAAWLHET